MDLITIFKILYRRRWYIIGLPLFACILAIVLTSGYEKMYKSTAQLSTSFTVEEEVNVTGKRFSLYDADVKFSNLIETISSARVMNLLSYELLLHDIDSSGHKPFRRIVINEDKNKGLIGVDFNKVKQIVSIKLDSMKQLDTHNDDERMVRDVLEAYEYDYESLKKNISITRINRTDFVSIVNYSESPFLSAFTVNVLCNQFLRFNSAFINTRMNQNVVTFSRLVQEKRKELDRVSRLLQNFKSSNNMVNFSVERESKITRLSEKEEQLDEERSRNRSLELQLQNINNKINAIGGGNEEVVTNAKVVEIRKKINALNLKYQSGGSKDVVMRDSLNALRAKQQRLIRIASQESNTSSYDELVAKKSELEIELKISTGNIQALESNLSSSSDNIAGYSSKEARIDALEREVDLAAEDYRKAQEKYNESLNVALASDSSIQQILLGLPTSDPEPSKRLIVAGLTGMSVLIFVIVVIILIEYIDVTIKSNANFNRIVGLNLLGGLNHFNAKPEEIFGLYDLENISKNETLMEFKEHLKMIRFHITQSGKKAILFTSTKVGEGKTTLIQALAIGLSKSQMKVLIIDTNFANNELSKAFEASNEFEDLVSSTPKSTGQSIKKTKFPGVDIIGCQGGTYSPSEKIDDNAMKELIEKMKKYYHFIFMEGPSLNKFSDSRELSVYADGVITVFSAKSTLGQMDYDSINFIKKLETKNMGAILNNVEPRDMGR